MTDTKPPSAEAIYAASMALFDMEVDPEFNNDGELVAGSGCEPEDMKLCVKVAYALDAFAARSRWRPLAEWHEDFGEVLWHAVPVCEPPYVGSPLSSDWPGYHTHWRPLPEPPSCP